MIDWNSIAQQGKNRARDYAGRLGGLVNSDEVQNLRTQYTDNNKFDSKGFQGAYGNLLRQKAIENGMSSSWADYAANLLPQASAMMRLSNFNPEDVNTIGVTSGANSDLGNWIGRIASGEFGGIAGAANLGGGDMVRHLIDTAINKFTGTGGEAHGGATGANAELNREFQGILSALLPTQSPEFGNLVRAGLAEAGNRKDATDPYSNWIEFYKQLLPLQARGTRNDLAGGHGWI